MRYAMEVSMSDMRFLLQLMHVKSDGRFLFHTSSNPKQIARKMVAK